MAAVGALQVHCPECDVAVPITTEITPTDVEDNKLIINVEPDLTDAIAHARTHAPAYGCSIQDPPSKIAPGMITPPRDHSGSGPYST
ncbi:hypothetical protein [Streptomyces sp. NRRL F-5135]|uniref:hypothetical protein n=1 Tax=Streptomyces sp. NRRL F-5135 TaxID=1463858 RepID=UPI00068AA488|nr:hypothetical protein [Streptomyces sp. NRRL F-5135]